MPVYKHSISLVGYFMITKNLNMNRASVLKWKTCSLCDKEAFCYPSTSVTMAWIKAGFGEQKCTWRCESCQPSAKLMN